MSRSAWPLRIRDRARTYQDQGVCGTVKAFVVPTDGTKAGAQALADMQEELKRYCRERRAPHKIPRAVEFMEELPKTGQGKIHRRLLREQVL